MIVPSFIYSSFFFFRKSLLVGGKLCVQTTATHKVPPMPRQDKINRSHPYTILSHEDVYPSDLDKIILVY
jgi:hypothetical protein